MNHTGLSPGDVVRVRMSKADGSFHRTWQATVEQSNADEIVTYTAIGNPVCQGGRIHPQKDQIRTYFRLGQCYCVLEVFDSDGQLVILNADITSPIAWDSGELQCIDHELDVIYRMGQEPKIIDQDEFEEAAVTYGYSADFQADCHRVSREVLDVITNWQPSSLPDS